MDFSGIQNIIDKLNEIGAFLYETPQGILFLVGICLLLTLLIAAILERRTRRLFYNHETNDEEDDDEFDDAEADDDDEPIDLSNGILGIDIDEGLDSANAEDKPSSKGNDE